MLDSDILIELKRNKPEAWQWFNSFDVPPPVCGFAALELLIGCQNLAERRAVLTFLNSFALTFPTELGMKNALVISNLKLSHGLSGFDCLIAATALEQNATLYTFNIRHFRHVPSLIFAVPYSRP